MQSRPLFTQPTIPLRRQIKAGTTGRTANDLARQNITSPARPTSQVLWPHKRLGHPSRRLLTSPVDYQNPRAFSKLDLLRSLPKLSIPRGAISMESALQLRCGSQYQTLLREQYHRSPVVQSQYSDLPSGATQLSSGSHTAVVADFYCHISASMQSTMPFLQHLHLHAHLQSPFQPTQYTSTLNSPYDIIGLVLRSCLPQRSLAYSWD